MESTGSNGILNFVHRSELYGLSVIEQPPGKALSSVRYLVAPSFLQANSWEVDRDYSFQTFFEPLHAHALGLLTLLRCSTFLHQDRVVCPDRN